MTRLQQTRTGFFVYIPKSIVKDKKWHKGQEFVFVYNHDGDLPLKAING